MAFKLSFRFNRTAYHGTLEEIKQQITNKLTRSLNTLRIEVMRFYSPSRDSIKVLFSDEKDVNKALDKFDELKRDGFEPRISMAMKADRTAYCFGFDPTLLSTYTNDNIKEILTNENWKVRDVYIMSSKKSFKIEFNSSQEANKFIQDNNTNIGGIRLDCNSKELEIDPTVRQCWSCGTLNPNHNSEECTGPKKCLKCGSRNHQFYNCTLPKNHNDMDHEQKENRYCIPCRTYGDHTSLDHRYCPSKRRIVQERISEAREKRKSEEDNSKRDSELIKKTIEISSTETWPALHKYQQQQQMTTSIILLAILDENSNQGIFQQKLNSELAKNGLPLIKYTLEHNTAQSITNIICAANSAHLIPPNIAQQGAAAKNKPPRKTLPASNLVKKSKDAQTQQSTKRRTSSITKFSNDSNKTHKRKGSAPSQLAVEDGVFSMDESNVVDMIRKKQDKKAPHHNPHYNTFRNKSPPLVHRPPLEQSEMNSDTQHYISAKK